MMSPYRITLATPSKKERDKIWAALETAHEAVMSSFDGGFYHTNSKVVDDAKDNYNRASAEWHSLMRL